MIFGDPSIFESFSFKSVTDHMPYFSYKIAVVNQLSITFENTVGYGLSRITGGNIIQGRSLLVIVNQNYRLCTTNMRSAIIAAIIWRPRAVVPCSTQSQGYPVKNGKRLVHLICSLAERSELSHRELALISSSGQLGFTFCEIMRPFQVFYSKNSDQNACLGR